MPKLYFYDTGLACSLLGIRSKKDIAYHPLRGNIFENYIIGEFFKLYFNKGLRPNLFFWRDNVGNEIDLIMEDTNRIIPVEIKSGQTIHDEFFKGLKFWQKISHQESGYLIYGGEQVQTRSKGITVLPWNRFIEHLTAQFE